MAWSNLTPPGLIFTTAINLAEIVQGLAHMQDGHRRRALTAAATQTFNTVLAGRVLPFDADAAHHYGEIFARRTRLGRPIGVMDAQIAAIASTHGATLVSRDTAGFTDCGITLLNPWLHPH